MSVILSWLGAEFRLKPAALVACAFAVAWLILKIPPSAAARAMSCLRLNRDPVGTVIKSAPYCVRGYHLKRTAGGNTRGLLSPEPRSCRYNGCLHRAHRAGASDIAPWT